MFLQQCFSKAAGVVSEGTSIYVSHISGNECAFSFHCFTVCAILVTATGTIGSDSLNGKIGNGGCELRLTDSNSNIEILKAK